MKKLEYITVLPVVLYGYGTCSVTLKEEYRMKVFEDRVLRDYLDLRGKKWCEVGENCIMRSCVVCTHQPVLLG
jgi:hypothetical protein